MLRVTAQWTGFSGAPGYSNFFFAIDGEAAGANAQACVDKVGAFFNVVKSSLPGAVRVTLQSEVAQLQPTNGQALEFVNAAAPAAYIGSQTGTYSSPTGACVTWLTAGVRNGRRVRGRTFLVPLASNAYQADGTLNDTDRTNLLAAATTLATGAGPQLLVWSRPSVKGAADGAAFNVTGPRIQDKAAVLRSRRD